MPNITIKSENNKSFNVKNDFKEKDKLYVFAFWATWCAPCLNELDAINEKYAVWSKELNFEVIAVSIDDTRTQKRVKPLLNGKKWPYTILRVTLIIWGLSKKFLHSKEKEFDIYDTSLVSSKEFNSRVK